ncbi:MAG: AMP-binding protein, partial [Janthinobacterium lividum]
YDFYSLRYVFSAAEKLRKETRDLWLNKYGIRILEGYGSTEAAPIIAANTPMHQRPDTVGRLMPKMEYFIKPVKGVGVVGDGGKLYVRGPNVTCGHIMANKPGLIQQAHNLELGWGWYDTGDIATSNEEGYITLQGRAEQLIEIDGKLVFLQSIENTAYDIDSISTNAVTTLKSGKDLQKIFLFTNSEIINQQKWPDFVTKQNLPDLYLDVTIINIQNIPLLTVGKIDYKKITQLAQDYINE